MINTQQPSGKPGQAPGRLTLSVRALVSDAHPASTDQHRMTAAVHRSARRKLRVVNPMPALPERTTKPTEMSSPSPSAISTPIAVSLSTTTVARGNQVTVNTPGLASGESAEIRLHSAPIKRCRQLPLLTASSRNGHRPVRRDQ